MKQKDVIASAFGDDPSVVLSYLKSNPFNGMSFSGGECFLVFDRLMEWLMYFRKRLPAMYYWVYTNGLSADEVSMRKLADAGMNEIRFNIAATGYRSSSILERIETSVRLFQKVAVEVPSIPGAYEALVDVLPSLDRAGIDYLNLHEYILVPGDPAYQSGVEYSMSPGMNVRYDRESVQNSERVRNFCRDYGLRMKVNCCSLEKKRYQMLLRRQMMGKILKRHYEKVSDEGFLETYLLHPEKIAPPEILERCRSRQSYMNLEKYFFHPGTVSPKRKANVGTCAKLCFSPPLSLDDSRTLLRAELIQ